MDAAGAAQKENNHMEEFLNLSSGVIISVILLTTLIAILIFLILRNFWCWYYKINQRVKNQEEIIELMKKQNVILESIYTRVLKENKNKIDINV